MLLVHQVGEICNTAKGVAHFFANLGRMIGGSGKANENTHCAFSLSLIPIDVA